MAAITDRFAAACHQSRFLCIEWERQTTDGAVAGISAFRLFKQKFVTQLSHPFFACSFVLRPMFFLTLNAAISKGFTGGACLQFYFVDFCNAAGSANVGRLSVFAAHYFNLSLFFLWLWCRRSECFPANKQQAGGKRAAEGRGCVLCWFFLFSVPLGPRKLLGLVEETENILKILKKIP